MIEENGALQSDRILRINDVIEITSLSRSQIYRLIDKSEFPRQVKLTSKGKISGWLFSEVQAWINDRVNKSRNVLPMSRRL